VRSPREFAEAVENGTGPVGLKVLTPSDRNAVERDIVIKPR
jgi:hypothetical protein